MGTLVLSLQNMHHVVFVLLVISPLLGCSSVQLFEGDECEDKFGVGFCIPYPSCATAVEGVARNHSHGFRRCGFVRSDELVCCPSTASRQVGRSKSALACANYSADISVFVDLQIVRGRDAEVREFPSVAALGKLTADGGYEFDCAGTLVSGSFVVTAAHCVFNIKNTTLKVVRMGVVDVPATAAAPDERDFAVKRVVRHPNYTRWGLKNDIALVELEKEVAFTDNVRPACLDTKGPEEGGEYVIVGWGAIDTKGTRKKTLQKGYVTALPFDKCNPRFAKRNWPLNNSLQMCTVEREGDTCEGDSGGPLFLDTVYNVQVLVGITSNGLGMCGSRDPTVYTKVSSYLKWIEDIVWP